MVTFAGPPETPEEHLRWELKYATAQRDTAERKIHRITALLQGPLVMVEAHWMQYGGHDTHAYYTVEEAAARLTQMYEDGTGAPLGVTLCGVPIPWGAYDGTDVHEPDPSNFNFARDTS